MITWNRKNFEECGFVYAKTQVDTLHQFNYEGNVLQYQLIIDEEYGQVSISGDTESPFGGDSIFEIYARFKTVVYQTAKDIEYRRFLFSFYDSQEPSDESLRLTIGGRLSDSELVVWPYIKGRNQAC